MIYCLPISQRKRIELTKRMRSSPLDIPELSNLFYEDSYKFNKYEFILTEDDTLSFPVIISNDGITKRIFYDKFINPSDIIEISRYLSSLSRYGVMMETCIESAEFTEILDSSNEYYYRRDISINESNPLIRKNINEISNNRRYIHITLRNNCTLRSKNRKFVINVNRYNISILSKCKSFDYTDIVGLGILGSNILNRSSKYIIINK